MEATCVSSMLQSDTKCRVESEYNHKKIMCKSLSFFPFYSSFPLKPHSQFQCAENIITRSLIPSTTYIQYIIFPTYFSILVPAPQLFQHLAVTQFTLFIFIYEAVLWQSGLCHKFFWKEVQSGMKSWMWLNSHIFPIFPVKRLYPESTLPHWNSTQKTLTVITHNLCYSHRKWRIIFGSHPQYLLYMKYMLLCLLLSINP